MQRLKWQPKLPGGPNGAGTQFLKGTATQLTPKYVRKRLVKLPQYTQSSYRVAYGHAQTRLHRPADRKDGEEEPQDWGQGSLFVCLLRYAHIANQTRSQLHLLSGSSILPNFKQANSSTYGLSGSLTLPKNQQ